MYGLGFLLSACACGMIKEEKGFCRSLLENIISGVLLLLFKISISKGLHLLSMIWVAGCGMIWGAGCGIILLSTFMRNMLLVLLEVGGRWEDGGQEGAGGGTGEDEAGGIGNSCLSLLIGGLLTWGVFVDLGGVGRHIFCNLSVCIS